MPYTVDFQAVLNRDLKIQNILKRVEKFCLTFVIDLDQIQETDRERDRKRDRKRDRDRGKERGKERERERKRKRERTREYV